MYTFLEKYFFRLQTNTRKISTLEICSKNGIRFAFISECFFGRFKIILLSFYSCVKLMSFHNLFTVVTQLLNGRFTVVSWSFHGRFTLKTVTYSSCSCIPNLKISLKSSSFACEKDFNFLTFIDLGCCLFKQ